MNKKYFNNAGNLNITSWVNPDSLFDSIHIYRNKYYFMHWPD